MSQFKMQMPGGRARRAGGPDVYTAMAFVAVAFLAAACIIMWQAGMKVAPQDAGSPFQLHEGQIKLTAKK
ncbi:MAG TPA: hypothetical protein VK176_03400 [Phycisphaerales bacterium]|nr:hypothetical protein [Phycisphaerales bacterium]